PGRARGSPGARRDGARALHRQGDRRRPWRRHLRRERDRQGDAVHGAPAGRSRGGARRRESLRARPGGAARGHGSAEGASMTGETILVAEDDQSSSEMLKELLELSEYTVEVVETAR